MKRFLLLLAVVALSTAAPKPGGYNRESYHFNQESATFKNNELQHKNEETGRYSKFEDLDNTSPPQVQTSYQQTEYNNPEADSNRWAGVKGRPRMYHNHHQQQGTYRREWRHETPDEQQTGNFGSYGGHHHGHHRHRVYHQEQSSNNRFDSQSHVSQTTQQEQEPGTFNENGIIFIRPQLPTIDRIPPVTLIEQPAPTINFDELKPKEQPSNAGSLYQNNRNNGGSGRDYWLRTEGQSGRTIPTPEVTTTENIKPVYEPLEPSETASDNREARAGNNDDHLTDVYAQINQIAQLDMLNHQQNTEKINLQNHGAGLIDERQGQRPQQRSYNSEWTVHGQTQQNNEDSTEQETEENITEDLTQQSLEGFDDLKQQTQQHELDLTQQSQSGFEDLTQQTQQTQDLYPKLEVSAQQKDLTQQTQDKLDISQQTQQRGEQNRYQQTQSGFGGLEFSGHQQEDLTQQHEDLTQQTQQHGDLTQQTQDGFGKLEFGQQHEDLSQQTQTGLEFGSQLRDSQQRQTGLDLTQQHEDLTQQTQDGFDKLEFGQQNEDLTQQTQTGLEFGSQLRDSQQRQTGLDLTQQHEDLTQQTQDGFGKLEFGQQHEATQQTQTGLEFGSQQRDSSQQRQTGYGRLNQQQEDQTQQHEDLTQQTQHGFGNLENWEHEDLTQQQQQQTQHGFGNLELGQQHEDLTQQHQQTEDLTQQTQHGFGNLQIGQEHEDLTQQHQQTEDLVQQTQSGFELGSQQRDSSQQRQIGQENEHLTQQHQQNNFGNLEFSGQETQQTQDGFGQLEIGSQYQQSQNDKDFLQQTQDGFGKLENQKHDNEEGQFEFGQQKEDKLSATGLQQGRTISQSHSNSGSYSSHQHQSNSGSYSRTLHYGQASQIPPELTTQDLHQHHEDQQVAQQVQDVSQQVQKVEDLNLEEQKENLEDFNQHSNQEILGKGLPNVEVEVEVVTTQKPGFWKRVGSSISSTYENAKEKSKSLADKLKQNLG